MFVLFLAVILVLTVCVYAKIISTWSVVEIEYSKFNCIYSRQDIVYIDRDGLVKLVLTPENSSMKFMRDLRNCSDVKVFDKFLNPRPYYVDYCSSEKIEIWVNATEPLVRIVYGSDIARKESNGYMTFSKKIYGNVYVTWFHDFHSIEGFTVINGSVRMLNFNTTIQSYGVELSEGTAILSMLHEYQRVREYRYFIYAYIDDTLDIYLSYSYDPFINFMNISLSSVNNTACINDACVDVNVPKYVLIEVSVSSRVSLKINNHEAISTDNPFRDQYLEWIGFKARRSFARIFKLYFTPISLGKALNISAGYDQCVNLFMNVLTRNFTGLPDKIVCSISCHSFERKFKHTYNDVVPALTKCVFYCYVYGVNISKYEDTFTDSTSITWVVDVYHYIDYHGKDRYVACEYGSRCIIEKYRKCGVLVIDVSRGKSRGTIIVFYSVKPRYVVVKGTHDYSWYMSDLILRYSLNISKGLVIIDKYMLEVIYEDTLNKTIYLPGTYVIIDNARSVVPYYSLHTAGPTNITVMSELPLGYKFKAWSDGYLETSRIVNLNSDSVFIIIYRVPTIIDYRYRVKFDKETIINIYGTLRDIYNNALINAEVEVTCNESSKKVITDKTGLFNVTLTLPRGDYLTCSIYYPGNDTYVEKLVEFEVYRFKFPIIEFIIIFTVIVIVVALYVYFKRREKLERK